MKIGIIYNPFDEKGYGRFGGEKFNKIKEHGFDAIDYNISDTNLPIYSFDKSELEIYTEKEKKMVENAGLEISQVHGPWRWPPNDATEEFRAERMEKMQKSLEITKMLGCKFWVVHPLMPFGIEEKGTEVVKKVYEMNLAFMKELLIKAKELGITICLENMPMPKFSMGAPRDILDFVKEINDENFKICFDTGHAEICNELSVANAVRLLGKEIKVFHIHDNKYGQDLHLMPYQGNIDWAGFARALADIDFNGVFSLETAPSNKLETPLFEEMSRLLNNIAKEISKDL